MVGNGWSTTKNVVLAELSHKLLNLVPLALAKEEITILQDKIRSAMDAKDKDLIVNSCEELNKYTQVYAEQAMNSSIQKALKGKKV